MSELKFKMGTKSSTTPTTGNSGEVFFTTDENKYGHIYFIDKVKKVINIVPELLEVKFGGTGKATHTINSVLVGNNANAIKNIISNDGALYATGLNDEPRFGTLPVGQGGTGNTKQTANRLIYASSNDVLSSSDHYASSSKVSINSTTEPSGNHIFYVNGSSLFDGDIYGKSILPSEDMNSSYTIGNTSYTWYTMYARNLTLYDGTNGYAGGYLYTSVSNATTAATTVLELGNETSVNIAGNRYGILRLYSQKGSYQDLVAHESKENGDTEATSRTSYLRDYGTTAYLAATSTRNQVGSGVIPVYVSTSGVITASVEDVGDANKPVYMTEGEIVEGNMYGGGTAITLNGASKAASTASFYAPTTVGTNGYILKSNGSGAPTWLQILPIANGGTGASTAKGAHYNILNSINAVTGSSISDNTKMVFCYDSPSTTNGVIYTRVASQLWDYVVSKTTVSNSWTAGTTAGPKITTTVNGVAGTAVAIPVASSSASGVVTTGAQTFAGTKTMSRLRLTATTDAQANADAETALIIGTRTGAHLSFDANEIIAKSNETTATTLYLNNEGGLVHVGSGGLTTTGVLTGTRFVASSTAAVRHLEFSRAGYNYITAPADGNVSFVIGSSSLGAAYAQLMISENAVSSGTGVSLGTSSYYWNGVYGRSFRAKNSSDSTNNASFTVENYDGSCSVSLIYGAGQANAGVYDNVNGQWMMFRVLGTGTELAQKTTRLQGGVAFSSVHGTETPGTSTAGYGVTGAVYFKRV